MEQKKHFKTILISLLMVGAMLGGGYGVSTAFRHPEPAVSTGSTVSETPMVPANFSDLAEKVRPGVVNIQVVKKVKNVGFGFRNFSWQPVWGEESFWRLLRTLFRRKSAQRFRTAGCRVRVCHEPRRVYPHQ